MNDTTEITIENNLFHSNSIGLDTNNKPTPGIRSDIDPYRGRLEPRLNLSRLKIHAVRLRTLISATFKA